MNKHQGNKTGDFLYHYYLKRSASFLVNVYTAGITAKENDIHKTRVDLKKIFALLGLFEMIDSNPFILERPQKIFRTIYNSAGKIREIQMNLLYMENKAGNDIGTKLFSKYLKNNLRKETKRFIRAVMRFDEKELKSFHRYIKATCREIKIEKIIDKCDDYFQVHSARIKKYRLHFQEIENIHKMRKEMKKLSAVADLLKRLRGDDMMEKVISALNQAEIYIGEWHDRIVFSHSLDSFLRRLVPGNEKVSDQLETIKKLSEQEADNFLKQLLPEVDNVAS